MHRIFRLLQELRTKYDIHRQHTNDAICNSTKTVEGISKSVCTQNINVCISKIVTWDSIGLEIFCGKRNKNDRLPTEYSARKGIITKIELFNDRKLYMVVRGRWCDITVLNVHAPTAYKNVDPKNDLYSLSTNVRHIR